MAVFYEFFAGVGMVRVGLGPAWQCELANDNDRMKGSVYRANFGGAELRVADVASLKVSDLPGEAGLAWASFPCQDLSLAGAGAGLNGARSGVFWSFAQLMAALKAEYRAPRLIVLENVTGLLTSKGGEDFRAISAVLGDLGYRHGALVVDAIDFIPQSRPRLFDIAVRRDLEIPDRLISDGPPEHHAPASLRRAVAGFPPELAADFVWWRLPAPPARTTSLIDVLDDKATWDGRDKTEKLLAQLSPASQRDGVLACESGERTVGALFRRTRPVVGPQTEIRFDGVAGCLRVATGGSSRQSIIEIEGDSIRTRLLSPHEAGRLMGLPDSFRLPSNFNDALSCVGDGVAVPVVRFLDEHLLTPLLDNIVVEVMA